MFAKKALAASVSAAPKTYVDDVFSTYLYSGTGSTQTITNGIDLSGEGGMTWFKVRSAANYDNAVVDSVRGVSKILIPNRTNAEATQSAAVTSYNSNGFTLGTDGSGYGASGYNINPSGISALTSWTFRKAEKFFDVVTFTLGNTNTNLRVSHNLGSVPGTIIVKSTNSSNAWFVYHRSLGRSKYLVLNTTSLETSQSNAWGTSDPTTTDFGIDATWFSSGASEQCVAYIFAHDAAGFGDNGDQSIINCGSYTGNGSATGPTVTLNWEPQWVMIKRADGGTVGNWFMLDVMRKFDVSTDNVLLANSTGSEATGTDYAEPTATGFQITSSGSALNANGSTYIYIAIRRGPMKTPEAGTSVFYPYVTASASNVGSTGGTMYNSQIVTDLAWQRAKGGTDGWYLGTRLTGTAYMKSETTAAESTSAAIVWDSNRGAWSFSDANYGLYCFKRAPGFFDVVCYTGTGATRTVSHNLAAVPELLIVKRRDTVEDWNVYSATTGNAAYLRLNTTAAVGTAGADAFWGSTTPTSSVFTVKTSGGTNASGGTYVAYLFASVAGVSKVGSYTGTGTTLQINCGFTSGARFVLIKRTDSTGDWYVWDSARGIVSGNDPYLLLNSTAAEVTNTDYIDTYSSGFEISSTAPAAINANGGTFIFLAVA